MFFVPHVSAIKQKTSTISQMSKNATLKNPRRKNDISRQNNNKTGINDMFSMEVLMNLRILVWNDFSFNKFRVSNRPWSILKCSGGIFIFEIFVVVKIIRWIDRVMMNKGTNHCLLLHFTKPSSSSSSRMQFKIKNCFRYTETWSATRS